jgi:hypothetical protein
MDRLGSFLAGLILGAVSLHVASNFYIVRSDNGTHLIPKLTTKLELPYHDIRNFNADSWKQNPQLAAAVQKAARKGNDKQRSVAGL